MDIESKTWTSDDVPGMLVMRTVCMLANEAADAVNQGVCDAAAVDTAHTTERRFERAQATHAQRL